MIMGGPLLVVTAVAAERQAVEEGLGEEGLGVAAPPRAQVAPPKAQVAPPEVQVAPPEVTVAAVGVGPAAAAAGTARLLALAEAAGRPYRAVVCAGIAGGFPGRAEIGAVVLATRSIQADLGADSPDGFHRLDRLGLGPVAVDADLTLLAPLAPGAITGEVLTVSTVTGTAERAAALAAAHPAAVAEAMEGYGVGSAAAAAGVPFAEVRTIANLVGPRDRSAWRIPEALAALRRVSRLIVR